MLKLIVHCIWSYMTRLIPINWPMLFRCISRWCLIFYRLKLDGNQVPIMMKIENIIQTSGLSPNCMRGWVMWKDSNKDMIVYHRCGELCVNILPKDLSLGWDISRYIVMCKDYPDKSELTTYNLLALCDCFQDKVHYQGPIEESLKAMVAWGWTVELDSARTVTKAQIKHKMCKSTLVSYFFYTS